MLTSAEECVSLRISGWRSRTQITRFGVAQDGHLSNQVADQIGGSRTAAATSDHHVARQVLLTASGPPCRLGTVGAPSKGQRRISVPARGAKRGGCRFVARRLGRIFQQWRPAAYIVGWFLDARADWCRRALPFQ
jgi:hypothetical protein